MALEATLQDLLLSDGYLAIFMLIMLESLGLPLPGETVLLLGAALAGSKHLAIGGVVLAGAAGAILGDALGYWIGRLGGRALLRRYEQRLGISAARQAHAEALMVRYGARAVFFGRFVALLRTLAALLAGALGMSYGRFTLFNIGGGLCWVALVSSLGYLFGAHLTLIAVWLRRGSWLAALVILAALLIWQGWRRWRQAPPHA